MQKPLSVPLGATNWRGKKRFLLAMATGLPMFWLRSVEMICPQFVFPRTASLTVTLASLAKKSRYSEEAVWYIKRTLIESASGWIG